MRYQKLFPWFLTFLREWALPKGTAVSGVVSVSAVLFSLDPAVIIPGPAQKRFDSIFAATLNPLFQRLFYVVGALFLISLAARHISDGRFRKTYILDRNVARVAALLNTIIGLFLIPMAVSITALVMLPGDHTRQLEVFTFTALCFSIFSACFHYMGGKEGQPRHSITYAISPCSANLEFSSARFHYMTFTRLSQVLSHVPWHEGPEVASETSDRHIVLVVPIYLNIASWDSSERAALRVYLSAIELEWSEHLFVVVRADSDEL
jgi:hypothetical protein